MTFWTESTEVTVDEQEALNTIPLYLLTVTLISLFFPILNCYLMQTNEIACFYQQKKAHRKQN